MRGQAGWPPCCVGVSADLWRFLLTPCLLHFFRTAIYFAFLGFYTTWLAVPALVGCLVMLYGLGNFDNREVYGGGVSFARVARLMRFFSFSLLPFSPLRL